MTTPRAIAVIPARAGSSRVKDKNFRKISGTSLTEMALEVAQEAGFFSKIILSTDSPLGEDIAARLQVVLHRRSALAASNTATATDTLLDIESTFTEEGVVPSDYIFYLQPTSPLRTAELLKIAWDNLKSGDRLGVVSVVQVDPKYSKVMKIKADKLFSDQPEQHISSNQQNLEPLYLANGNVFAFRYQVFIDRQTFPLLGLQPMIQDPAESLDIDSEQDFEQIYPTGATL